MRKSVLRRSTQNNALSPRSLAAQYQPYRRIVVLILIKVIKHTDVTVHLSYILMREFAYLKVYQHVAFQYAMVNTKSM